MRLKIGSILWWGVGNTVVYSWEGNLWIGCKEGYWRMSAQCERFWRSNLGIRTPIKAKKKGAKHA